MELCNLGISLVAMCQIKCFTGQQSGRWFRSRLEGDIQGQAGMIEAGSQALWQMGSSLELT